MLTLSKSELAHALSLCSHFGKPFVSNVVCDYAVFTAKNSVCSFFATNMETHVTHTIEAPDCEDGIITAPIARMKDIVSTIDGDITLEPSGDQVILRNGTSEWRLSTIPHADFPKMPEYEGGTSFEAQAQTLIDALSWTLPAVPSRDHRRVLMGVRLGNLNGSPSIIGTDGKKLFVSPFAATDTFTEVTIPHGIADTLRSIAKDTVSITVNETGQLLITTGNTTLRTTAIEGKYPDISQVIPKDFPVTVTVSAKWLADVVRRAGVVAENKNRAIVLEFTDTECIITGMAADVGAFTGKLDLVEYVGKPITVAFNSDLLRDLLKSFGEGSITINIKSEHAPVKFTSDHTPGFKILMPIKMSEVALPAESVNDAA